MVSKRHGTLSTNEIHCDCLYTFLERIPGVRNKCYKEEIFRNRTAPVLTCVVFISQHSLFSLSQVAPSFDFAETCSKKRTHNEFGMYNTISIVDAPHRVQYNGSENPLYNLNLNLSVCVLMYYRPFNE